MSPYYQGMSNARMEILVEPFKENDPGPHVTAVIDAARAAGVYNVSLAANN